jgi:hypothetical protein
MIKLENEMYTNFWNAMRKKPYEVDVLNIVTKHGMVDLPTKSLQQLKESPESVISGRKTGF